MSIHKSMTTRRNFIKKASVAGTGLFLANKMSIASKHFGAVSDVTVNNSIISNRTREVNIRLTDKQGKPLQQKIVQVELLKHDFLFGDCNPSMDSMYRQGAAAAEKLKIYRKVFSSVLNAVNATCYWTERPRNNMAKTEEFQGEYQLEGFNETVDWGLANGLSVKGHPLFWTVPKAIPDWLLRYDYQTQLKFLEVRLRSIVGRYRGRVCQWDSINEMLWEPALKNLAQRTWPYTETFDNMVDYISFVLRICREEDPDTQFLINDYGLERNHNQPAQLRSNDNDSSVIEKNKLYDQHHQEVTAMRQRERYLELVKRLCDKGFQPAAIGMQGHSGAVTTEEQLALYDQMATSGLPLHITEFWAHKEDFGSEFAKLDEEEKQERIAAYVVQYMKNAFGHPSINCIFFWGFMGMATQFREGFSTSYTEYPLLNAVRNLIKKEWHTKEILQTNGDGMITFRGFYGDYSLRYNPIQEQTFSMAEKFRIDRLSGMPLSIQTAIIK